MLAGPRYGHRVRICTHPHFKDFIESHGVEFFSIGGDPEALMAYMVKNMGLIPSRTSIKAGDVKRRRKEMWEIINGCWRSCIEAGDGTGDPLTATSVEDPEELFLADLIIANPPSMAHIHCAEKLSIPLHMVFTMPWSLTEAFPHPLSAMAYRDADQGVANYMSFLMVELLTWEGLGDLINRLRVQTLNLDPLSAFWGSQLLFRLHVPYTYLWSEALVPKPKDWRSYINITGFSFLPSSTSHTPPPELRTFLKSGPAPIYIGFGSIVVDDPLSLTKTVFEAIRIAGVRAIVSESWSTFRRQDNIPENVFMLGNCPHDWLFPQVAAVVHHGGAGTTAAGIATGKPTVIVPFFGDQPFWGQMIARGGAGPMPIPFKALTADNLADSIKFSLRPEAGTAALNMARIIASEHGASGAADDIQARIDRDALRCALSPDRIAIWEHKVKGTRISGFAMACLIEKGLVDYHDVKIIRHKTWNLDDGAKHPLVGAAAAASSFITAIMLALGDYSNELKKRPVSTASKGKPGPVEPNLSTMVAEDEAAPLEDSLQNLSRTEKLVPGSLAQQPTSSSINLRQVAVQAKYQGRRGNSRFIMRATGRLAGDLSKACLRVPVSLSYNIANGFHNLAWYSFMHKMDARRRDEIDGWKSGLRAAAKESSLSLWEAFTSVFLSPYLGVKEGGMKGLMIGTYLGARGCFCLLGAYALSLKSSR
ncbi:hypothetical protein D7B24_009324 [Verticillium nonalfalfae]|uniref:Uncharacterized protein n=1 Tax=Verticillium nonalfalfae TaxID=1051616 RepID=A0A3M9Y2V9_9PEZI|nr:uncharacterized protein D7B24_009324 [Verticillium nonalfalfae]RNJ54859.1 hypothetical protein D7B24_009324 [Verticillium nonalfalfae]